MNGFTHKQLLALRSDVDPAFTRTRKLNDGRELPYIEGWYAIAQANRIFGFDGWSRETVEVKCLQTRGISREFHALYLAKVRLTVRAGEGLTIREGYTRDATGNSMGEVHEKALKTAETDATKRALATFGRPFGLALHVPAERQHVSSVSETDRRRTRQRKGPDGRYRLVNTARMSLLPKEIQIGQAVPSQDGDEVAKPAHAEAPAALPSPGQVVPITRPARKRSASHLRYVMGQPCLICTRTPSDAHHLRFTQPRAMASKVSDEYTVPLCRTHHRQLHHSGDEVAWWIAVEVDPLPRLRKISGKVPASGRGCLDPLLSEPTRLQKGQAAHTPPAYRS